MFPCEFRHSVRTTGGSDVSDCIHYGVGIAIVSGRVGRIEGHVAECTIKL